MYSIVKKSDRVNQRLIPKINNIEHAKNITICQLAKFGKKLANKETQSLSKVKSRVIQCRDNKFKKGKESEPLCR